MAFGLFRKKKSNQIPTKEELRAEYNDCCSEENWEMAESIADEMIRLGYSGRYYYKAMAERFSDASSAAAHMGMAIEELDEKSLDYPLMFPLYRRILAELFVETKRYEEAIDTFGDTMRFAKSHYYNETFPDYSCFMYLLAIRYRIHELRELAREDEAEKLKSLAFSVWNEHCFELDSHPDPEVRDHVMKLNREIMDEVSLEDSAYK